ncbi:MAG: 3'-5' exonuclease [Dehalococcoidia bacterium]|nr:3'-5' exonuclease [Dehalococcoidia bacterium]
MAKRRADTAVRPLRGRAFGLFLRLEDGAVNDRQIEEELRLTYVAMTRAKDFLYVLWPQRYYVRPSRMSDRHSFAQCSRFFTGGVLSTMDLVASVRSAGDESEQAPASIKEDIVTSILDMWE